MIPLQPSRRTSRMVQPQVAVELLLTAFALIFAALLLRLLLRLIAAGEQAWTRATIDHLTAPFVWPLVQLPGARHPLVGQATLPDFTVVAICLLILLALGSGRRRS
jgi:hypothetical protein